MAHNSLTTCTIGITLVPGREIMAISQSRVVPILKSLSPAEGYNVLPYPCECEGQRLCAQFLQGDHQTGLT